MKVGNKSSIAGIQEVERHIYACIVDDGVDWAIRQGGVKQRPRFLTLEKIGSINSEQAEAQRLLHGMSFLLAIRACRESPPTSRLWQAAQRSSAQFLGSYL